MSGVYPRRSRVWAMASAAIRIGTKIHACR